MILTDNIRDFLRLHLLSDGFFVLGLEPPFIAPCDRFERSIDKRLFNNLFFMRPKTDQPRSQGSLSSSFEDPGNEVEN